MILSARFASLARRRSASSFSRRTSSADSGLRCLIDSPHAGLSFGHCHCSFVRMSMNSAPRRSTNALYLPLSPRFWLMPGKRCHSESQMIFPGCRPTEAIAWSSSAVGSITGTVPFAAAGTVPAGSCSNGSRLRCPGCGVPSPPTDTGTGRNRTVPTGAVARSRYCGFGTAQPENSRANGAITGHMTPSSARRWDWGSCTAPGNRYACRAASSNHSASASLSSSPW